MHGMTDAICCLGDDSMPGCRHNLTSYAMKLNEVTPGLKEKLAPTDCRLRPDQRATEVGEYDLVSTSSAPRPVT